MRGEQPAQLLEPRGSRTACAILRGSHLRLRLEANRVLPAMEPK